MPGVNVITSARSAVSPTPSAPSGRFFIAGLTQRGPTDEAVRVASLAEFENAFGSRVAYGYVYDAIRTFFAEGGGPAFVTRVVGPAATTGTLDLDDSTPAPVLTLDARGAGDWSTGVSVTVEDGAVTGSKKVTIAYENDREVFNNLTTNAAIANAITQRSKYVTATDLGEAALPANVAGTALSAGTDDRASVTAADYVTALDTYALADLGDGAVAVPGQDAGSIGEGLIAHAKATNRVALLADLNGASVADVIGTAQTLRDGADAEYAGLFYPWVVIPGSGGARLTVPPEGFVAAGRARAVAENGPWRPGAGDVAQARFVIDLAEDVGREDGDALNEAEVNAIRKIARTIRTYGWRSLSADEDNYRMLSDRDTLNYIASRAEVLLEQFVFRTIDGRGQLFSDAEAAVTGLVEPIAAAGGLYALYDEEGNELDPGYGVDTGPDVNTAQSIANNELRVALTVRLAPTAETVTILITKVGVNSTF